MIRHTIMIISLIGSALCSSVAFAHEAPPVTDSSGPITSEAAAITAHGFSPSRLLALGRAQLDDGKVGPAIASLERGLVLAPRNARLRAALAQARERAGLPATKHESMLSHVAHQLSLREWAYAAFASILFASVALIAWSLTSRRHWFAGLFALAGLAASVTLTGVVITRTDLQRAYVLQDGSAVRQSPFATATALTRLHAGESVETLEPHADYVYVETEEGLFGWMARDVLAPLAAGQT
jgi:hypothetical protein